MIYSVFLGAVAYARFWGLGGPAPVDLEPAV